MSEASQEAPEEVFMQKAQQDKHSGLNSSPNVSGHLATQLDVIEECAWYFPQCCVMLLTVSQFWFSALCSFFFFFFDFAWIFFLTRHLFIYYRSFPWTMLEESTLWLLVLTIWDRLFLQGSHIPISETRLTHITQLENKIRTVPSNQ